MVSFEKGLIALHVHVEVQPCIYGFMRRNNNNDNRMLRRTFSGGSVSRMLEREKIGQSAEKHRKECQQFCLHL